MQKSKNWTKKIVLVALAGTIGMSFSGCKNKEGIAIVQETDIKTNDFYFVPDLVLVEYNAMYKKCVKVMQLEFKENDIAYFKSITDEEIGAVITNFDSEEEKCIVTNLGENGDFVYDENFKIGNVNHHPEQQLQKLGEINENNEVSYSLIEKVEEELEKEQEEDIIDQENKYAEDLLKYRLVLDANEDIILTSEVREISYILEGKNYELLGYLEKETPSEKIYRSITTPENSIVVKTNEEGNIQYNLQINRNGKGQETIELHDVLGDYPAVVGRCISFPQALDFETSSFISYNYQKFNKTHEEVTALVCKVEDDYHMKIMDYVGEFDNQVLYQAKVFKNAAIWVLGTQNEEKEIVDYQIVGPLEWEGKAEFVSMDIILGAVQLSDDKILKIEKDYESKKRINENFNLVENSNGEWKIYESLAQITYKVKGVDEAFVMMAGLEKVEENKNFYCCITIPEIYLEETFDEDTYTNNYRFIPAEGIKEDFTQTTEVTNVAFMQSGKTVQSFDEIQTMEDIATRQANEELNSGLGR